MADEWDDLAALIARLSGSGRAAEMALRLGQSLEITDGLWELVPVVVAAGQTYDQQSSAEMADKSAAGMALDAKARRRLRNLGDSFTEVMDSAAGVEELDEFAWSSITVAQVMADPFGTLGSVIDIPA